MMSATSGAAVRGGVSLPDTATLGGTELHLNGIALRTYSWLHIRIYVAGLYLQYPSHEGDAILDSPEKKLLVVRFVHDVSANRARQAWRRGFQSSCLPPCHLSQTDIERFISAVPAIRAGDLSTFSFTPANLSISFNGRVVGTISDRMFARAVLATFIGPRPTTPPVKYELLGLDSDG